MPISASCHGSCEFFRWVGRLRFLFNSCARRKSHLCGSIWLRFHMRPIRSVPFARRRWWLVGSPPEVQDGFVLRVEQSVTSPPADFADSVTCFTLFAWAPPL